MNPQRYLLLVDDNLNDLHLTLGVLESEKFPFKVVVANDGVEALDYIYRRGQFSARLHDDPKVVLLDVKMPRVDGLEVLQQMKGDPLLKTIPVVMFTSSRVPADVARCYELGANAYVVKPVDYHEFVAKVREIAHFWMGTNEEPAPPAGQVNSALLAK